MQDVEELKPYEVALGPELLDQVENLLRDLDMPPVKVGTGRRNIHLLSPAVQCCGSRMIFSDPDPTFQMIPHFQN